MRFKYTTIISNIQYLSNHNLIIDNFFFFIVFWQGKSVDHSLHALTITKPSR